MEAVQVISVVFFDKNVFIVIMCDFIEICCKDIFFYLFKQVFYKKIVSLMFFTPYAFYCHSGSFSQPEGKPRAALSI